MPQTPALWAVRSPPLQLQLVGSGRSGQVSPETLGGWGQAGSSPPQLPGDGHTTSGSLEWLWGPQQDLADGKGPARTAVQTQP